MFFREMFWRVGSQFSKFSLIDRSGEIEQQRMFRIFKVNNLQIDVVEKQFTSSLFTRSLSLFDWMNLFASIYILKACCWLHSLSLPLDRNLTCSHDVYDPCRGRCKRKNLELFQCVHLLKVLRSLNKYSISTQPLKSDAASYVNRE